MQYAHLANSGCLTEWNLRKEGRKEEGMGLGMDGWQWAGGMSELMPSQRSSRLIINKIAKLDMLKNP